MDKITLSHMLKGCKTGKIQSVGIMQMIPLVSELNDERFSSPSLAKIATSDYGTLVIDNSTDKTMIIPAQAAYVVKQHAQDHALPHAGLIKASQKKFFDTAMCIQQSQGGYIKDGEHKMIILPFPLREVAHKARNSTGYDRLWNAISKFNSVFNVTGAAHLEYFLDSFKSQLDNFIAEFEPVPNQVGAIILIDGKVVGVERGPSEEYWYSIWPALVRECYGGLALYEIEKHKNKKTKKGAQKDIKAPVTRVPLKKVKTLAALKKALEEADKKEYDIVKKMVEDICAFEFDLKEDSKQSDDGLSVNSVKNDRFIGQVICDGEKVVYGSLFATQNWRDNADWFEAPEFTM